MCIINNYIMIELVNLTKIYHTEAEGSLALKGISIKFPEKGFVAITGESGSGKTTLLNVLSGFVSYEEGDLFIDGVDFLSFSEEDLENYRRNDVGFVFQDYHLIEHHTVLDNLIEVLLLHGINYKAAKKKSLDILKKFDLYEQRTLKARSISSGQKQKLAIARALVKEPKIILCDEPTANLDPETSITVLKILADYSKDHLVVVSTHNYEDAQGYATHFVRIYKGVLTAYETLKEVDGTSQEVIKNKKSDVFNIFGIGVKNQIPLTISKVSLSTLLTAGFIFLLTLFSANIDETSTRIISHDTFNNVNQNEIQIIRKDRAFINQEEMIGLNNVAHITGSQLYGLATEMNYYYRLNVDYEDRIIIINSDGEDYVEHRFATLHDNLFLKSYEGIIKESDLSSGLLPTEFNEICVYGDYQIGDIITAYFHDGVLQSSSYFKYDFVVSGLLKDKTEEAYFSPKLLLNFDYMQSTCRAPQFRLQMDYKSYNQTLKKYVNKKGTFVFTPIFNPNIGPLDIQLSSRFLSETDDIAHIGDISDQEVFLATFSDGRIKETTGHMIVKFNGESPLSDDIGFSYLYVGEDIYHMYIDDYNVKTGRVYVDDYSYLDDVIKALTDRKYDCLSEYRASSGQFDEEKQNNRAFSLIFSLILLFVGSFIYLIIGYLLQRGKIGADKTLHLLGGSLSDLRKTSAIEVSFVNILGLILGSLLYVLVYFLPIAYINNINRYLRYYHFIIAASIVIVVTTAIFVLYVNYLNKKAKKGSVI